MKYSQGIEATYTEEVSVGRRDHAHPGQGSLILPGEELRNGIWPRSVPLWMAAFYVALFIIRPWEQLMPWLGAIRFERLYAICMITAVFLSTKKEFRMGFQTATVFIFIASIALSAFFAVNTSLAWPVLYQYLTLVVFYFVMILLIRTPYQLVFMVSCYILTMTIYLAKSEWEFFVRGQHRYSGQGVVRLIGIENSFGGPNSLAMSIVVSLPMLLFLWSVRKEFTRTWPPFWKKWFPRFLGIYFILAVSSIILTNSRSGMLSFVLFVFLVTLRGKGVMKKAGYTIVGLLLLLGLWLIIPQESKDRFRTIWNPQAGPATAQASAQGRIEGFKAGMEMFSRFPLTGVGVGNFIPYRVRHVDGVPLKAHNLVGQLLGETGIIGGVAFLLLIAAILANCSKIRRLARGSPDTALAAFAALGVACRDSLILLFFEGLFAHNVLRFNWLWLAAFSLLAVEHGRRYLEEKNVLNYPSNRRTRSLF